MICIIYYFTIPNQTIPYITHYTTPYNHNIPHNHNTPHNHNIPHNHNTPHHTIPYITQNTTPHNHNIPQYIILHTTHHEIYHYTIYHTTSYHTKPYHTISPNIILYYITNHNTLCTIPHITPNYTTLHHILSHTMNHTTTHTMPYHTTPYHTTYHTIPHHTIPQNTILQKLLWLLACLDKACLCVVTVLTSTLWTLAVQSLHEYCTPIPSMDTALIPPLCILYSHPLAENTTCIACQKLPQLIYCWCSKHKTDVIQGDNYDFSLLNVGNFPPLSFQEKPKYTEACGWFLVCFSVSGSRHGQAHKKLCSLLSSRLLYLESMALWNDSNLWSQSNGVGSGRATEGTHMGVFPRVAGP